MVSYTMFAVFSNDNKNNTTKKMGVTSDAHLYMLN